MISKDERELLIGFAKNKPLFEAVRKQLLKGIIGDDIDFTNTNWIWGIDKNLSDAAYGKLVKQTRIALEWIRQGFLDIAVMDMQPDPGEKANQAR